MTGGARLGLGLGMRRSRSMPGGRDVVTALNESFAMFNFAMA